MGSAEKIIPLVISLIYLDETSDKTITKNTIRNKKYCILEYLKLSLLNKIIIDDNKTITGIKNGLIPLLKVSSITSL